ncbi:hypothetical protein MTO96_011580 [Rhipicephalus appendiculatus]
MSAAFGHARARNASCSLAKTNAPRRGSRLALFLRTTTASETVTRRTPGTDWAEDGHVAGVPTRMPIQLPDTHSSEKFGIDSRIRSKKELLRGL